MYFSSQLQKFKNPIDIFYLGINSNFLWGRGIQLIEQASWCPGIQLIEQASWGQGIQLIEQGSWGPGIQPIEQGLWDSLYI